MDKGATTSSKHSRLHSYKAFYQNTWFGALTALDLIGVFSEIQAVKHNHGGLQRGLENCILTSNQRAMCHLNLQPRQWWFTFVSPVQKRLNTSFMLPPFCMEITLRWSSSLIQTRKVLLSLCLGDKAISLLSCPPHTLKMAPNCSSLQFLVQDTHLAASTRLIFLLLPTQDLS